MGSCGERPLSWEEGRDGSLIETQAPAVWNGPLRSAMALECFRITGTKGLFQMHIFQMRMTVSSGIPNASDTMRQPETKVPIGGTPTLRRISMTN